MRRSPTHGEHLKRLELAVWFSQVDLKTFREGDWVNLVDDLNDFVFRSNAPSEKGLLGASRLISLHGTGRVQQLRNSTRKEIESIQAVLLEDLKALAFDPQTPRQYARTSPIKGVSIAVEGFNPHLQPFMYALDLGSEGPKDGYSVTTTTRVRAAFFEYLTTSGVLRGQLRVCPECRRIFLVKRRPRSDLELHCSLRCSRLAATRRYRKKLMKEKGEEVRAKERERSHRRYKERVRQKPGHALSKVERKPRRAST